MGKSRHCCLTNEKKERKKESGSIKIVRIFCIPILCYAKLQMRRLRKSNNLTNQIKEEVPDDKR
jgi:hypothetical protein